MEEPGEFIEETKPVDNSISPLFGVIFFLLVILPFGGFWLGQVSYQPRVIEVEKKAEEHGYSTNRFGYDIYFFGNSIYTYNSVSGPGDEELKKVIEGVDRDTFEVVPEFQVGGQAVYSPLADGGYYPRWFQDKENFYCVEGKGVETTILSRPVKFEFTGVTTEVEEVIGGDIGYDVWIENETRTFGQLHFVEEATGKVYDNNCREVGDDSFNKSDNYPVYTVRTYRDNEGWNGAWLMEKTENSGEFEKVFELSDDFVSFEAVLKDGLLYLRSGESLLVADLESQVVRDFPLGERVQDILMVDDLVLVQTVSIPTCIDFPDAFDRCTTSYFLINPNSGETALMAEGLPGAKSLVAYSPDTDLVIRNGYGDAGCLSSIFHRIDLNNLEATEEFSDHDCSAYNKPYVVEGEEFELAVSNYLEGLAETNDYSKADYSTYQTWNYVAGKPVGLQEHDGGSSRLADGEYVVPVLVSAGSDADNSVNESEDLVVFVDKEVGIQFAYPRVWGEVTVHNEKGNCDPGYSDDDCSFRTYLFTDLSKAGIFMAAETSGHHSNPIGRGAFWGDRAGSIGETYLIDCEGNPDCILFENETGLVLAKHKSDPLPLEMGDLPERYYLYNPGSQYYGVLLSPSRINVNESIPELFESTIIQSLSLENG